MNVRKHGKLEVSLEWNRLTGVGRKLMLTSLSWVFEHVRDSD